MCPVTDNPVKCKIYTVICFFQAKIMSSSEVHFELCMFYGTVIMSERNVRWWCSLFKGGQTDVQHKEWSGGPTQNKTNSVALSPRVNYTD
jgi:hypothetical protein